MNFVGHAVVATWTEDDPRWVLGSMLPDFASMSRNRLRGATEPVVQAGIELHLRTDDLFHRSEIFLSWTRSGEVALRQAGVDRGPSAAAAHVGAELVLDGWLLEEVGTPALANAYRRALRLEVEELGLGLVGAGSARLHALLHRLADHGLPNEYRSASGVVARLERALSSRPTLALQEADRGATLDWIEGIQPTIARDAPLLMDELRRALTARP